MRLSLDAGLIVTYAYLLSDTLPTTHFFRPGASAHRGPGVPAHQDVPREHRWSSALYVPQRLGTFTETKPLDESIFHVGQAYLLLHFRVPFTATM